MEGRGKEGARRGHQGEKGREEGGRSRETDSQAPSLFLSPFLPSRSLSFFPLPLFPSPPSRAPLGNPVFTSLLLSISICKKKTTTAAAGPTDRPTTRRAKGAVAVNLEEKRGAQTLPLEPFPPLHPHPLPSSVFSPIQSMGEKGRGAAAGAERRQGGRQGQRKGTHAPQAAKKTHTHSGGRREGKQQKGGLSFLLTKKQLSFFLFIFLLL